VAFVLREQYRRQGGGNENSEDERFQATAPAFGRIRACAHFTPPSTIPGVKQAGSTSQQQRRVGTVPLCDVVISIKIDAHRATLAPGNCWRPQDSKNIQAHP
jgi:hypothetical protein